MNDSQGLGLVVGAAIIGNRLSYDNRVNAYISQGYPHHLAKMQVDREYAEQGRINRARPWGLFARFIFLPLWMVWWVACIVANSSSGIGIGMGLVGSMLGIFWYVSQRGKRRRWNAMWRQDSQTRAVGSA